MEYRNSKINLGQQTCNRTLRSSGSHSITIKLINQFLAYQNKGRKGRGIIQRRGKSRDDINTQTEWPRGMEVFRQRLWQPDAGEKKKKFPWPSSQTWKHDLQQVQPIFSTKVSVSEFPLTIFVVAMTTSYAIPSCITDEMRIGQRISPIGGPRKD